MRIRIGPCEAHQTTRRRWIGAEWLLFLVSIASIVAGFSRLQPECSRAVPCGMACLLLLCLVVACIASNSTIRPKRIAKDGGEFSGAGEGCLVQFPGT